MIVLIILGIVLLIGGLIGCIVPAIPGPPLSFVALILLEIATHGEAFTTNELIIWGIVSINSVDCWSVWGCPPVTP